MTARQYMTLRELMSQISSTRGIKKIPTAKKLREDSEVVDVYTAEDYRITVYKSGFAVAQSGRHMTVVRVDECGAYTYGCDNSWLNGEEDATPHQLDADYFLDLQWPIRLMLTADDQLEENQDSREAKWIGKHPEVPDDKNWMLGGYSSFEDALLHRMEMEELLGTMTDKQRKVYLLYYKYGYTQLEIGKKMGVSQVAVNKHLVAALKKAKKFYENNI